MVDQEELSSLAAQALEHSQGLGYFKNRDFLLREKLHLASEVGEMIGAYLKLHFADMVKYSEALKCGLEFVPSYDEYVKDSFECESADVVIMLSMILYYYNGSVTLPNAEDDHMEILHYFDMVNTRCAECNWWSALRNAVTICNRLNIDIIKHVRMKIVYNSLREDHK